MMSSFCALFPQQVAVMLKGKGKGKGEEKLQERSKVSNMYSILIMYEPVIYLISYSLLYCVYRV